MAILDGIADAVVKLDGQANFVAMNQSAANIYQRLGLNFQDIEREIRVRVVTRT